MRKKKNMIEMKQKGVYRLRTNEKGGESELELNEIMIERWRAFCRQYSKVKTPTYDMTEEEFRQGKQLYELNKEMEKLILSYKF